MAQISIYSHYKLHKIKRSMKFNLSFHTCKVNIENYFEQQIRMIVVCFIRVIQNHSHIGIYFSLKKKKTMYLWTYEATRVFNSPSKFTEAFHVYAVTESARFLSSACFQLENIYIYTLPSISIWTSLYNKYKNLKQIYKITNEFYSILWIYFILL